MDHEIKSLEWFKNLEKIILSWNEIVNEPCISGDGGPSLSIITSSIKPKGKLMDVICEALEEDQVRKKRTVSGTVVQSPVHHPRVCT